MADSFGELGTGPLRKGTECFWQGCASTSDQAGIVGGNGDESELVNGVRTTAVTEILAQGGVNGNGEQDMPFGGQGYDRVENIHVLSDVQRAERYEIYLRRGNAKEALGEHEDAIVEYTRALQAARTKDERCEIYWRRADTFHKIECTLEAIEDMSCALVDCTSKHKKGVILSERGRLYYLDRSFSKAVSDLETSVELLKEEVPSCLGHRWSFSDILYLLGATLKLTGRLSEAREALNKSIQSGGRHSINAMIDSALICRELGDDGLELYNLALLELYKRLEKEGNDSTFAAISNVWGLRGELWESKGDLHNALRDCFISFSINPKNTGALVRVVRCAQSLGAFSFADKMLYTLDSSDERRPLLQHILFYMKSRVDMPLESFNLDEDLPVEVKEGGVCGVIPAMPHPSSCETSSNCSDDAFVDWSQDMSPVNSLFCKPGLAASRDSIFTNIQANIERRLAIVDTTTSNDPQLKSLVSYADQIGQVIQLSCVGFSVNHRQHRQCGVSMIQMGQTLRGAFVDQDWTSRRSWGFVNFMNIAVFWRQLSDPCAQVFWINRLTKASFEAGFGLETSMEEGHYKVPRYYMYCNEALSLAKTLLVEEMGSEHQPRAAEYILEIPTAARLVEFIGTDFWVTTRCNSKHLPGTFYDGTRLKFVSDELKGVVFSICTPCTPVRWAQFVAELDALWGEIIKLGNTIYQCERSIPSKAQRKHAVDLALTFFYFWVSFSPLTRGTAATGYTAMFAILLSMGVSIPTQLPPNMQLDWLAILSPNFTEFVKENRGWLDEPTPTHSATVLSEAPLVTDICGSLRKAVQILKL
eukprot:CAMPEP_0203756670 /NCGR_PEP_ID=MMETSP0098-20131031/9905_1 /ASSEMBLY_ACC=CAM_ASM_000208 /TAXON_ID=96639 /ORGANISM=" , Strain NY0313808BC1" /LENGTH=815 /DNA_ID=CAMNT_0050648631 /DNA_START=213 /DNA_END=2657 /DNA_ORIENTATION=+